MPEPVVDAAQSANQPAAAPAAQPNADAADQYFLEIDERSRFKTADEAKTGYLNLKNRLLELDPWAKKSSQWSKSPDEGGFGLQEVNPDLIDSLLNELAERRYKEAQAKSASQPAQAQGALDASKLTPEWQQHIQFLREQAKFATTDDVQAIRKEFEQQAYDRRVDAAVQEGQSILASAAKEAGLPTDPAFLKRVFKAIESEIMEASEDAQGNIRRDSPEYRFIHGDSTVRQTIIQEYLKPWSEQFTGFAKAKNAAQANEKSKAMGSQPRPLPAGTAGAPAPAGKRLSESELRQGVLHYLNGGGQ